MKKLLSLFLLLFAVNAFAQTEIGWVTAVDCGTITDPLTNGTICLQVENGSGRIAGHTYRWNGSTWFDITFDPDVNITGINGAIPSVTNPMPSRLTDGTTFYKATTPSDTQPVSGTVSISGSVAVTGPLTDTQLRATPVPVSGTVTTGGLTDTQLRATPVPVSGTVAATQSGTWTVQPGNTANTTAWKVDGSAVTQPVSGTVTAAQATAANLNATVVQATGSNLHVAVDSMPTVTVTGGLTDTQLRATPVPVSGTVTSNQGGAPWQVQSNSANIATEASLAKLTQTQASTTSGQSGPLVQGATTTAAPTYTTATTNPLSLTTAGALRVDGSGVTQPISGSVSGSGNFTVVQPTGTNLHAVIDSGSTTAVTGNVTVVQPTGTKLHAVLDATSTTAVTQATAANLNATVVQATGTNLHAVIDSGSTTAVTGNVTVVQPTGTNLHTVLDSGTLTSITNTVTTQDSQAAADNSTNSSLKTPVLPARANAAAPAWTEGNQVPLSVDLLGNQRVASNPRNQYNIELGTQQNPLVVAMAKAIPSTAPVQTAPLTIASNRLVGAFGQPIGTTADRLKVEPTPPADPCVNARKRDAPISQTATSIVIPNMQGMSIFVCAIRIIAGAAEIVSEWEGSGTACGTGTIAHSGSATAANGESLAANGGFAMGDGNSMLSSTLPGNDYCIAQSTSSRVSGKISYVYAQ